MSSQIVPSMFPRVAVLVGLAVLVPGCLGSFGALTLGPQGCSNSYECCIRESPNPENCGQPEGIPTIRARGPAPEPRPAPRRAPVETLEPVKLPESPPTRQPQPPQSLGPDVSRREQEEASKRTGDRKPSPERPPRPNNVEIYEDDWKRELDEPRYRPCFWKGSGGAAPGNDSTAPLVWIRCTYQCGRYQVRLFDIRARTEAECNKYPHLKRAESEAKNFDDVLQAKGF